MGFIIHFYIIFGTNILTGGPAQICYFYAYFSVSRKRNIRRSQNRTKSIGEVIFGRKATRWTWSAHQEIREVLTRVGARPTPWAHPPSSWPPRGSSDFISKSPGLLLVQEISSRKFHSVWTPFGIPFLRNSKVGKKQKLELGPRLIS